MYSEASEELATYPKDVPRVYILDFDRAFRYKYLHDGEQLPQVSTSFLNEPPEYVYNTHSIVDDVPSDYRERRYGDASTALGEVHEKVDISALGCTFYELLVDDTIIYSMQVGRRPDPEEYDEVDATVPKDWWQLPPRSKSEVIKSIETDSEYWDSVSSGIRKRHSAEIKHLQETESIKDDFDCFTRLLRYMLVIDPRSTPNAEEVMTFLENEYSFTTYSSST